MPSESAIKLAEIFEAAMNEANLELVPRTPVTPAPGGVPIAPAAVTPVAPGPTTAPTPAQPPGGRGSSLRTVWAWNGVEKPPDGALIPASNPAGQALAFLPRPDGGESKWEPPTPSLNEGDLRWYELEVFVPRDSPYRENTWQLFTQWSNFGLGSAPLELGMREGRFELSGGLGHPAGPRAWAVPLPLIVPEHWTKFTVGVMFSANPTRGWVTVAMDGRVLMEKYRPDGGTLYPQQSSLWRVGYATGSRAPGRAIALRGLRVGAPAA